MTLPFVLSIDPEGAADLDDAIGLRTDGKNVILDICLPDVPSFVPSGGQADSKAQARAFTRYVRSKPRQQMLDDTTVQYLTLSSRSSQPMVWVELTFSPKLAVTNIEIQRIRHRTAASLTYAEADRIMDNPKHALNKPLLELAHFAKRLHNRRQVKTGATFDLKSNLYTAEDGTLHAIAEGDRYNSHLIVMEAMIAANAALASYAHNNGLPVIYRNHKPANVTNGYRKQVAADLQANHQMSIAEVATYMGVLNANVGPAHLGPVSQGHWGLDQPHYAWFTSPLRRYCDIINLRAVLGEKQEGDLEHLAAHLNSVMVEEKTKTEEFMKRRARFLIATQALEGDPAIEKYELHSIVNALADNGKGNSEKTHDIITERLKDGRISSRDLILILEREEIDRPDTMEEISRTLIERPVIAMQVVRALINSDKIITMPMLDNSQPAITTMLREFFTMNDKAVSEQLQSSADSETIVSTEADKAKMLELLEATYGNDAAINAKGKMLELAAKKNASFSLHLVSQTGPAHERYFTMEGRWRRGKQKFTVRGGGSSRAMAERNASQLMLKTLADKGQVEHVAAETDKHPKSALLEHAALTGGRYKIDDTVKSGPDHASQFTIKATYRFRNEVIQASGTASNLREAERLACAEIIARINAGNKE